ncbi:MULTISPECIES: cytochrome c family protein [unclassified Sinorhizobium]|uniref:c-type cytochrome n=1 Tax=unclassified Sinorhizobium TaxID=2613772 RepID=UPI003523F57E
MQAAIPRLRISASLLLATLALLVGVGTSVLKDRQQRHAVAIAMTGGDPSLAPAIFRRYGCGGCHMIAGIPGADGKVGPPLVNLRQRVYVGGVINNTPQNLIGWIVSPQHFSPKTAMPPTGISEQEARHLAAYLYAQ